MRGWGDGTPRVAVVGGYGEHSTRGEVEDTLAARGGGEAVEDGWAEEPAGEGEPDGGRDEVLREARLRADRAGAGGKVEEEGCGDPEPKLLGEVHVQRVLLGREVVRLVEVVGLRGDEGVGGVEVRVVPDGVERAK